VQPAVPENPQLVTREMQRREAAEGLRLAAVAHKQPQPPQQQGKARAESLVRLR
jgi:hypothetical protein